MEKPSAAPDPSPNAVHGPQMPAQPPAPAAQTDARPRVDGEPLVAPPGAPLRKAPDAHKLSLPLKRRIGMYLVLAVTASILLFALYVYARLNLSYSDGDRSGLLQKFSRKGWFCKTYEGELTLVTMPGQMAGQLPITSEPWAFSVRDEEVAKQVNAALGHKVVLHYAQHPGVPTTCFGETEYFVDGVRVVP